MKLYYRSLIPLLCLREVTNAPMFIEWAFLNRDSCGLGCLFEQTWALMNSCGIQIFFQTNTHKWGQIQFFIAGVKGNYSGHFYKNYWIIKVFEWWRQGETIENSRTLIIHFFLWNYELGDILSGDGQVLFAKFFQKNFSGRSLAGKGVPVFRKVKITPYLENIDLLWHKEYAGEFCGSQVFIVG